MTYEEHETNFINGIPHEIHPLEALVIANLYNMAELRSVSLEWVAACRKYNTNHPDSTHADLLN